VATSALRPLSIGEILDAGIKVVLRHWKPLAIAIVGLTVPVWIVFVLILASIDPEQLEAVPEESQSTAADISTAGAVGLVVLGVLLLATFAIAFTACFKTVSDAWLGSTASSKRSLRYGLRRSPKVALLTIIWYIGLIAGFVACILPGFWLLVAWSVSIPVMLFEGTGPFKALRRSFSLIKGRWWASFLLLIVGYLLVTIIGTIVQYGLLGVAAVVADDSTLALAVAQIFGFTLASAITYPYLAAVLTILYFDQRVRKEGFDLQLMADRLGAERDPNAPLPAPLIGDELYTPEQRAAAPYWPPPPGWTPPPAQPQPSEWSSSSGWSAPSADREEQPLWGAGGAPRSQPPSRPRDDDAAPTYPSHDQEATSGDPLRRGDEPPPSSGGWSGPTPPGAKPADEKKDDDDDKPDRGRADWLPPEAPRGPGGL
jgi:hypothetical protein